jgi:hypothetical protein
LITLKVEKLEFKGQLNDSPTARLLVETLPVEGEARRWGDEFYFSVPVKAELEPEACEVLSVGDLGYWPVGRALCLFWGPTPASQEDEIRAASPVNLVGKFEGDYQALSELGSRVRVRVEKA